MYHEDHAFVMMGGGWGLVGYLVIAVPFAIGAYLVGERVGRPGWLWAVLVFIPLVNFFFMIYAFFAVVVYALDRLNQAAPPRGQADQPGSSSPV